MFSCAFIGAKGIKIKITAKFRASRRLRFEDTKRIMSPKIRPKSFGTFEKQAPGPSPIQVPGNFFTSLQQTQKDILFTREFSGNTEYMFSISFRKHREAKKRKQLVNF